MHEDGSNETDERAQAITFAESETAVDNQGTEEVDARHGPETRDVQGGCGQSDEGDFHGYETETKEKCVDCEIIESRARI
jgi:hypothetical protein